MGLLDLLANDTKQRAYMNYGLNDLINQSRSMYPMLKDIPMTYQQGSGYLESYPPGEIGSSEYPRPKEFPIDKFGIQIRNTNTTPEMVAGDYVSHYMTDNDKYIKSNYEKFIDSLTTQQKELQKKRYNDYVQGYYTNEQGQQVELPKETRPFQDWKEQSDNDGIYRGLLFNQWSPSSYTDEQHELARQAKKYLGIL